MAQRIKFKDKDRTKFQKPLFKSKKGNVITLEILCNLRISSGHTDVLRAIRSDENQVYICSVLQVFGQDNTYHAYLITVTNFDTQESSYYELYCNTYVRNLHKYFEWHKFKNILEAL